MLIKCKEIAEKILPYVLISDIDHEYIKKCRVHAEEVAPILHENDKRQHGKDNSFYVRSLEEIIGMTKHGKLLEVAYCMVFELNPDLVDFSTKSGPDQYDIEFNGNIFVDVATAHIQSLSGTKELFETNLLIRQAKFDRTKKRIRKEITTQEKERAKIVIDNYELKHRYLVNTIALMQKNEDKIFYIGDIPTQRFMKLHYSHNPEQSEYYYSVSLKGRKESGNVKNIQLFDL